MEQSAVEVTGQAARSASISAIRLGAFLLIVSCHMLQYLRHELAWWLNVGVQVFLCLSGYLYGQRRIADALSFYAKRAKRILIPYYVVLVPALALGRLLWPAEWTAACAFKALLCVDTIPGGGHLWFVPTILMCYLLTPTLQMCCERALSRRRFLPGIVLLAALFAVGFGGFAPFFSPAWMTCYLLGYALGFAEARGARGGRWLAACVVALSSLNLLQIYIQYIGRIKLYGLVELVYDLSTDYNHVSLGVTLFLAFKWAFDRLRLERSAALRALLSATDRYSYAGYLVHGFLILGPMSLMELTGSLAANILIILAATALLAVLAQKAAAFLERRLPGGAA